MQNISGSNHIFHPAGVGRIATSTRCNATTSPLVLHCNFVLLHEISCSCMQLVLLVPRPCGTPAPTTTHKDMSTSSSKPIPFISTETTTTTDRRARYEYAHSTSCVAIVKVRSTSRRTAFRRAQHLKPRRILQCTVEQISRCSSDVHSRTVGRCQQRTPEQIVDIPVPQVVPKLVEVFTHFSQDGAQHRFSEQIFEIPTTSLAEKISEEVVNTHVQHVVNTVKVVKPRIIKMTLQWARPTMQETSHINFNTDASASNAERRKQPEES